MFSREFCELFKETYFVENLNGSFWNTSARVFLWKRCKPDGLNAFNSIRNRSSHWTCSVGEGVLRKFAKITGNTCVRVSFLIKLQASGLQLYLKRESGTSVFLWIFRKFQETLAQVFLCKFCEVFKKVLYLLATTSHMMLFYPFCRSARFSA